MTATLATVANHPNRSAGRAGANPKPAEVIRLRTQHNLTQAEFGALVYKGWRTVQDWESGERRCPPDTWDLVQLKLKARDLLRRGRIAPQTLLDLGLQLPDAD